MEDHDTVSVVEHVTYFLNTAQEDKELGTFLEQVVFNRLCWLL